MPSETSDEGSTRSAARFAQATARSFHTTKAATDLGRALIFASGTPWLRNLPVYFPAAPLFQVQSFAEALQEPPPPFQALPRTIRPVGAPVALPSSSASFPLTMT